MSNLYEDIGTLIGEEGVVMTHMIPNLVRSIEPWLREHITDERYWDEEHDPTHVGEIELPDPTEEDRKLFLTRYMLEKDPLAGKKVIGVVVDNHHV